MPQIELTQGKYAIVDTADFEYLNQWKWYAIKARATFYAVRNVGRSPFQKRVWMHREIMNTPVEMDTDHRDGNGLNNQRRNLRVCTNTQNQANKSKQTNNTSGYKGVFWNNEKWQARICVEGKKIHLGHFSNVEDAARAYDSAAKNLYGEYARTNF